MPASRHYLASIVLGDQIEPERWEPGFSGSCRTSSGAGSKRAGQKQRLVPEKLTSLFPARGFSLTMN
jgi:hypothetical protein